MIMQNLKYSIASDLTVVIPTFNEEDYIIHSLYSLLKQEGIYRTRVIVVDNHSTDKTREKIARFAHLYSEKIKIEIIDGGRVGVARNAGAKLATTPYILFFDGDSLLYSNTTLKDALALMKSRDLHLLTLKIKSSTGNLFSIILFSLFNLLNRFLSSTTPFAIGTFFLTRRDIFNELGGFDPDIQQSEDFCLSRKYSPKHFHILNHYVGQDDRRFNKTGYFSFIKLVLKNFIYRNKKNHFQKDVGYWN